MFRPLGHLQVDSKIIIRGKYRVQLLVLHINDKGGNKILFYIKLVGCICVISVWKIVLITVVWSVGPSAWREDAKLMDHKTGMLPPKNIGYLLQCNRQCVFPTYISLLFSILFPVLYNGLSLWTLLPSEMGRRENCRLLWGTCIPLPHLQSVEAARFCEV
jgi:hypothetical protein